MKKGFFALAVFLIAGSAMGTAPVTAAKQTIKAIYIPLADHYAGIVAYEKYRGEMKKADYMIERMKSWPLLRAYFMSGEVDMAFIISPMAMDMFAEKPIFRWVGLLHRDGNALAINDLLNADVKLPKDRLKRKPDDKVAKAFTKAKKEMGRPSECGVPHLLATHTVVLYKYLKDYGKGLNLGSGTDKAVVAIEVPPPRSPSFIKKKTAAAPRRVSNSPCPGPMWLKQRGLAMWRGIPRMLCPGPMVMWNVLPLPRTTPSTTNGRP